MLQEDSKSFQSDLLQDPENENEPLNSSINESDNPNINNDQSPNQHHYTANGTKMEQTSLIKNNLIIDVLSNDNNFSKISSYQNPSNPIKNDPPNKPSSQQQQPQPPASKIINLGQPDTNSSDSDIIETNHASTFRFYSFLNTLDQNDKYFTSFIQNLEFGCLFEIFMLIPTVMYSFIGISILIIIYSILFRSILYFINSLICLMINECIKRLIKRKRPDLNTIAERMINLDGVLLVKKSSSMPSGDTAQATIFACTMIYTMIWYFGVEDITWWWMLITIPFVGFERCYFGKHWIGDTLCGAIEGILICIVVCGTIAPYLFF